LERGDGEASFVKPWHALPVARADMPARVSQSGFATRELQFMLAGGEPETNLQVLEIPSAHGDIPHLIRQSR
jgi:hypothetical protein